MRIRSNFLLLEKVDDGKGGAGAPPSDTVSKAEFDALSAKLNDALNLNKDLQTKNEEFSAKINDFETKKLEAEGNQSEIIERLKNENETFKSTNAGLKDKFSLTLAKTALKASLQAKGCKYVDDAISLYSKDLKGIEVNKDTFEVVQKSIDSLTEKINNEKSFLFSTEVPNVSDVNTNNNPNNNNSANDLSIEDMQKALREKIANEGDK